MKLNIQNFTVFDVGKFIFKLLKWRGEALPSAKRLKTNVDGSVNLFGDSILQFPCSYELTPLSTKGHTLRLVWKFNEAKNLTKMHDNSRMQGIAWKRNESDFLPAPIGKQQQQQQSPVPSLFKSQGP